MNIKQLLLTTLIATTGATAWAQTNATSITSGGYYRLYSAAKSKTLYADATNNGVSINQPTAGDNTDVYQLTGSSDNYTILSVGTGKYLNGFTYGNKFGIDKKNWVTLNNDAQTFQVKKNASARADADKSRWIIGYAGAAITDDNWFNTNTKGDGTSGGILRWKVDQGSTDDVASYFELYPLNDFTVTVTGETSKSVTITAKGHSSNASNGGTLYIDASAAQGDLTATSDGCTATVTAFDTSNKTITVNVSENIVGSYKLKTTFSETDYYFSLPTTEGNSPVLSTSEAEVQLVECGSGYMLKNSSGYYLAYKGGGNVYDLIATATVANAAVLTVAISGTTITLTGTHGTIGANTKDLSKDSNIYGDGGTSKTYNNTSWTIADFTAATTYTRVFEAAQSYTVCLPMVVNTDDVTNGKFYELASYSDETLHFSEVSGTTNAYKPYLFVTSAAGVVLSGDITEYSSQDLTTSVSGASMIGTIGSQTLVSGTNTYYGYRASDGVFVQVGTGAGAHIKAYRAYIQIPGITLARSLNISFDGETTGVSERAIVNSEKSAPVYNLSGQRIGQPKRGLYITNGKKIIIK